MEKFAVLPQGLTGEVALSQGKKKVVKVCYTTLTRKYKNIFILILSIICPYILEQSDKQIPTR